MKKKRIHKIRLDLFCNVRGYLFQVNTYIAAAEHGRAVLPPVAAAAAPQLPQAAGGGRAQDAAAAARGGRQSGPAAARNSLPHRPAGPRPPER